MVDLKSTQSLIKGMILSIIQDTGPEVIANLSPISDENALITALHMVSLAGLEEDFEKESDESKMLGPLPVKGTQEYKSLYYSDVIQATDATDERLIEHGSKVGVIILFDSDRLPDIRRAAGLIEPYLQLFLSKVDETSQITKEFAIKLNNHLNEIISKPKLRSFSINDDGVYEYSDPNYVRKTDSLLILDEAEKKMYFIAQKGVSPFQLRKMRTMVDELNLELYQGGYQIVKLESFHEIEPLLLKHGIKVR